MEEGDEKLNDLPYLQFTTSVGCVSNLGRVVAKGGQNIVLNRNSGVGLIFIIFLQFKKFKFFINLTFKNKLFSWKIN